MRINNILSHLFVAGSEIADQDSLDGQLPSNRHSAAAGHLEAPLPPPPKARPSSPPSGDGNHEPQSFTKGPASKHKKHRRLNREQVRICTVFTSPKILIYI